MSRTCWGLQLVTACLALDLPATAAAAEPLPPPLPGTKPLTEEGDLAAKMVQGIHTYLDRELAASVPKRKRLWKPDFSSPEAYLQSIEPNRERLRKYLGVVDRRLPPRLEYVGGPDEPALVGETDRYRVFAVRWAVLPGVDGEGLLLEPKGPVLANVIAVPDAAHTPEQVAGLTPGVAQEAQFARRLAEVGCRVIVPVLIDRQDELSANPRLNRATNQPHREFVHRMAYEMGRTLIGYEVQKVLAAVDWFQGRLVKDGDGKPTPVRIIGHGEGGRIAFYAAALDDRIGTCSVHGAFGPQEKMWQQPIYRNVWGLLTEFGDAEVAAGFWPPKFENHPLRHRHLQISDAAVPPVDGPPAARPGRSGAAPGSIATIPPAEVEREYERARSLFVSAPQMTLAPPRREGEPAGAVPASLELFMNLRPPARPEKEPHDRLDKEPEDRPPAKDLRRNFDPAARHRRQFEQLVAFTQRLWRDSDAVRQEFWKKADASSPEAWEQSCQWYRDYFHTEVIGKLPEPTVPLNPRTRPVYDEPKFTGYEVMLDVYPDVFAYGILLLPKDLKPGERRPVVVCQHGLEGRPTDTITVEKRPVYNHFSRRLVELGYIVYAPQNPYIGQTTFRQIQRKAQPLKAALFSFIVRQHQRTLDWLETLPNVDAKKIAFYGLSYGGKTAMRVPAIEKRYCLSICSADFNEWVGKNVSVELDRSYMWTGEYDMYEFDLGHTFNYAEMAYLIAPRPFMVERGHDDGVGTDEMVAYEYAKVRYLYANRLKVPDRTAIEFFPGGHQIHAQGTFEFLKQHLGYPK
jgi:dienelactone hydrolase